MPIREDLVNSAVSFLQDPSVAQASIEKKIAFLQSKNLTQEEIDVSLGRVGDGSAAAAVASAPQSAASSYGYGPPTPQQGYSSYPSYGWQQPPPEVPKRDWRDWFIMATVMGGVGYGIYFTAKRYIIPLIAPPTPPQLEQDKQTIDQSFDKAFTLLDQLNKDTESLKTAEETRTQRLDSALEELEAVLASIKENDRKREDDARRNTDEIRSLRDLIPKAMEGQKEATDARLQNLGEDLKSLSKLIGNRLGSGTAQPSAASRPNGYGAGTTLGYTPSVQNGSTIATGGAVSPALPSPSANTNGAGSNASATQAEATNSSTSGASTQERSTSSTTPAGSSSSRFGSGKASIPAWQMAAAKKSQEASGGEATDGNSSEKKDTSASGTAVEAN